MKHFFEQLGQTPKKILRSLTEQPCNNYCVDCGEPLAQNVDVTHYTFVCVACSAIHREMGFKIKSIGVSDFTDEEIERLQNTSNDEFNNVWMSGFKRGDQPLLPASNEEMRRQFIRQKYIQKKWHRNTPARSQNDRRSMFPENDDVPIKRNQNNYRFQSKYNDSYDDDYQGRNYNMNQINSNSHSNIGQSDEYYSDNSEDDQEQPQPFNPNSNLKRGNPFSNSQFPQRSKQNEYEQPSFQRQPSTNRNSPFQNHQSTDRNSPFKNHQAAQNSYQENYLQSNQSYQQQQNQSYQQQSNQSYQQQTNQSYQQQTNLPFQQNSSQQIPSNSYQQQNQNNVDLFDLLSTPQTANQQQQPIDQTQSSIDDVFGFGSNSQQKNTGFPQKKGRNADPFAPADNATKKRHKHKNKENEVDDLIGFSTPQNQPTEESDLLNFGDVNYGNQQTMTNSVSDDLLDFNQPQIQQQNDHRQSLKETLGMLDEAELNQNNGNTGNIQMLRNQGLGVQDSPILMANKLLMSGYCSQQPRQGYQGQMKPQMPGQQPYYQNPQ